MKNMLRKSLILLLIASLLCPMCACSYPVNGNAGTEQEFREVKLRYDFDTVEEGIKHRLSNKAYFDGYNQYDVDFRMHEHHDMPNGLDEYKQFAADQVLEFSDSDRKWVDDSMQRIEAVINEYKLVNVPVTRKVSFIKTTMVDEGDAAAYTHQSQIYLGDSIFKLLEGHEGDKMYEDYFDMLLWHELFHVFTRNNRDFKRDIYGIIGATVLDEEIPIPEDIKGRIMSNPDVDVFDSFVPLTINGEKKFCVVIPYFTKDFNGNKDISMFEAIESRLYPLNSDETYKVEDAEDFWDVFGKNTGYIIAIEETLADNFAYSLAYYLKGDTNFESPEMLEDILSYLMGRKYVPEENADEEEETPADADTSAAEDFASEEEIGVASEESGGHDNGSPWLNSDLVGNVTEDTITNPKDDLYLYANKEWMLNNGIPDGYSSWSHYNEVSDATCKKGVELLKGEKLEGHDGELIQTLFNLYCDMDARNKLGVEPFKEHAEKILSVETIEDITALFLDEKYKNIVDTAMSFDVSAGISDSEVYYAYISSAGLIMDDAADYTEETEYGTMLKDRGRELFEYMMGRIGIDKEEADKRYDDCIAFETRLAAKMYTNEQQMSSDYFQMINNEMSLEEVTGLVKNYPLKEMLEAHNLIYDKPYIVLNPEHIKNLDSLYTEKNVELFKNYMLVSLALGEISYMDEDAFNTYVDISNKYFGTTGVRPLEERAYSIVADYLGEPLAKEYIKKYSSEEDKKRVTQVCYDVIDTYREILENNDWASEETKEYAIKKLDSMTVNVGWPDKWEDYSKLDISGLSYCEACDAISEYQSDLLKSKLGCKPDPEMWAAELGDILTCNAFYDSQKNSINMIVGMMERPFYYSDMPVEELYASLGAFWIGHEVSHAFDSNGAQFDIDGNYKNWWTDEDYDEFQRRVDKMDKYLDTILIMDDYYVKGSNVDSEMIADMTGLQCALEMAKKVDNFDYKKFFEYFCRMNGRRALYSTQLSIIQGDVHPLDYMRGNVPAQQFEEFYETYDVKEGDGMYLAPEDRLIIW